MAGNTNEELRWFQAQLKEMLLLHSTVPAAAATAPPLPVRDPWLGTADAKARYFLGTEDLAAIRSDDVQVMSGGFGAGPDSRWYRESALKRQAILKYGAEEFERKMAARMKRQQNKRKREEDAAAAAQRLHKEVSAAPKKPTPAAERKQLEKLRASLLRQCRKSLGHAIFHSSVGDWRIECPNVTAAQFAALIFRPEDPTLSTLVKSGAFYAVEMDPIRFFGVEVTESDDESNEDGHGPGPRITGIGGKYGSNSQIRVRPRSKVVVRYQPSDLTLSVKGIAIV